MKKISVLVVIAVAFLSAVSAPALISTSAHNFSSETWNPGGQICQPCHTPHNAFTLANVPLWNHATTAATFTLYAAGGTLDATDLGQPAGVSKACLSCHDGTVALDSFGGATGTNMLSGSALLGTSLANDHPVSFTYDANLRTADGELKDPTVAPISNLLFGGKMECASCHDVHNTPNIAKLLVMSNASSALCLTCHNK